MTDNDIHDIKVTKPEWQSIYISIILAVLGYALAVIIGDANIFARFGSLIVCVGIIFGIKGLPQMLDAALPIFIDQYDETLKEIEDLFSGHQHEVQMREAMDKMLIDKFEQNKQKLSRTTFAIKKRLLRIEGGVLVIGTLIWGFGDCVVIPF